MLTVDPLTLCKTKIALDEEVEAWFERPSWCVLMVDLDRFKRFNDFYGLPAGDARLVATAHLLRSVLPGAEIYRLYGDKFFCLLEASLDEAMRLAHQIAAQSIELWVDWEYGKGQGAPVCLSVAHAPMHGRSWSELHSALFGAMNEAKFRGLAQVSVVQ